MQPMNTPSTTLSAVLTGLRPDAEWMSVESYDLAKGEPCTTTVIVDKGESPGLHNLMFFSSGPPYRFAGGLKCVNTEYLLFIVTQMQESSHDAETGVNRKESDASFRTVTSADASFWICEREDDRLLSGYTTLRTLDDVVVLHAEHSNVLRVADMIMRYLEGVEQKWL